jgi:hypothetical protein
MTKEQYAVARSKAMRWKAEDVPLRFCLRRGIPEDLPPAPTAIYIAEFGDDRCAYVGQTRQTTAKRLAQHALDWGRSRRWAYVWVVPLLDRVPDRELNRIEGRIGQLLKPIETSRLPAPY